MFNPVAQLNVSFFVKGAFKQNKYINYTFIYIKLTISHMYS